VKVSLIVNASQLYSNKTCAKEDHILLNYRKIDVTAMVLWVKWFSKFCFALFLRWIWYGFERQTNVLPILVIFCYTPFYLQYRYSVWSQNNIITMPTQLTHHMHHTSRPCFADFTCSVVRFWWTVVGIFGLNGPKNPCRCGWDAVPHPNNFTWHMARR